MLQNCLHAIEQSLLGPVDHGIGGEPPAPRCLEPLELKAVEGDLDEALGHRGEHCIPQRGIQHGGAGDVRGLHCGLECCADQRAQRIRMKIVQRLVLVPGEESDAESVVEIRRAGAGICLAGRRAAGRQALGKQKPGNVIDDLVAQVLNNAVVPDPAGLAEQVRGGFALDGAFGKAAQVEIIGILRRPAGHDEGQPERIRVFIAADAASPIAARREERIAQKFRPQQQMLDDDEPLVGAPRQQFVLHRGRIGRGREWVRTFAKNDSRLALQFHGKFAVLRRGVVGLG